MKDYLQDKGVDLLVGVLATFAAAAIVWLITQVAVPYLRRVLSDDVDPAGRWLGHEKTAVGEYTYDLELKARLRRWKGTATITRRSASQGDYRHHFQVDARKRGAYVVLNLLGDREHRGSIAVALFLLERRGTLLNGAWVYRSSVREVPEAETVQFKRT